MSDEDPSSKMYADLKQMPHTKEQRQAYKQANREKVRLQQFSQDLRKLYGITIDDYNALLAKQKARCALCGAHQSQFKRRLHVDHNHTTGEVRALLCTRCNPLIGYAQESVERLKQAIDYLTKFKK